MNIREINHDNNTPTWQAVVALGLPLSVVTVALPLGFNYGYRKVRESVTRNPKLFRGFAWTGIVLTVLAIIAIVLSVIVTRKS